MKPLAPADWDYFALDDVAYRGHRVSVVWDRDGTRYEPGKGLHLLVDGKEVASSDDAREAHRRRCRRAAKPPAAATAAASTSR